MLWRPAEHEPLTERDWDAGRAREAVAAIVADAEAACSHGFWPGHPLDDVEQSDRLCSIYLGTAGMAWGLWKLGSRLDLATVLSTAIEHYRSEPNVRDEAHTPSLMLGETGLLAVAGAIGSPDADRERLAELVHENREHPSWELLYGSPGSMLAARAAGLEREWLESADLLWAQWDEATGLWTQSFAGQVTRHLGAAHGFASNVHALRGYASNDELRGRVTRTLSRTAARDGGLINWPPIDVPMPATADRVRVQWCHGAPGIVSTVGDLMPRAMALAAGELVWRAGPLRKGSSLCHGTAGNGFTFLKLHTLTGNPVWLERARRLAMHAAEQVYRQRAADGRGRYTLFTGDIGVALYLAACLDATDRFPILDDL